MIFGICAAARIIEYFVLKTDETFLAENFIHKVFGIVLLLTVMTVMHLKWRDIGFKREKALSCFCIGVLLGVVCFAVSYAVEIAVLSAKSLNPRLMVYASGFSLSGNAINQTGIGFVLLCIIFNIVNVWMEEGVFRGLFLNILSIKYSFWTANILAALLFGIWHWVMPLRSYLEGESTLGNLLVMGIGYIILAGIMSIKWGVLYKMTGSLLAGAGDHLFNNVVATNLLHVVSDSGADELQIIRIMLAQLLSFAVVMLIFCKRKKTAE